MQLSPAVTATPPARRGLQLAIAVAGGLLLAEVTTLHAFVEGWVRKGNIPGWYYWTYQLLLAVVFIILASRKRGTGNALTFLLTGAVAGYVVSFVLALGAWMQSLGGAEPAISRLRPLGLRAAVELSLGTPLLLMAPVLGALPFACYLAVVAISNRRQQTNRKDGTGPWPP
ncbi:MAG TPA: hypothetical protein VF618_27980 [Thermoanaerobaculia bacterium]